MHHLSRVWLRVAAVLALIAAEAVLYGFSYPFFSLALADRGVATWLIGLNASVASAGILFVGPFLPRLIAGVGVRLLVAGQFLVSMLCFAALLFTDDLLAWFVARFIMGTCFAAMWTTTEIWLNGVAPEQHRGRIIGASGTLYACCQFLGPLLLGVTGATGPTPLLAAMVPLAMGVALSLMMSPRIASAVDSEEEPEGSWAGLVAALPIAGPIIAASFLTGIGETAMQSLLPLYGTDHGLNVTEAASLVSIFALGEAVMVSALGWLSDRRGRRFVLLLTSATAAASTLLLPLAMGNPAFLWPVLFVSGGTVAGLYTLGVVLIGQDFRGQRLTVVATGFAMAYSAGSVLGATPMGALMGWLGYEALPIGIGTMFLLLFLALLPRRAGAPT